MYYYGGGGGRRSLLGGRDYIPLNLKPSILNPIPQALIPLRCGYDSFNMKVPGPFGLRKGLCFTWMPGAGAWSRLSSRPGPSGAGFAL